MRKDMHAFLAIWSDIAPDWAGEWYRWHTDEHMPERVGIPGFLAGRRYERIDDGPGRDIPEDRRLQHCYMMYEGEKLTTFNSDAYIERLNHPTEWTREVAPAFQNFARGACQLKFSAGDGYGGVMLLLRFDEGTGAASDDMSAATLESLDHFVSTLPGLSGITAAHFGFCRPEITDVETNEKQARAATGEARFDSVMMIEACDAAQLAGHAKAILANLKSIGLPAQNARYGFYDLSYLLTKRTTEEPNRH
jgi:hypothetical protein